MHLAKKGHWDSDGIDRCLAVPLGFPLFELQMKCCIQGSQLLLVLKKEVKAGKL